MSKEIPGHTSNHLINKNYLFENKEDIFMDLFNDEFDTSWMVNVSEKIFTIIDPEITNNAIDDGSVVYYYNKQKFRSDDFTNIHNSKHILFAGCSETEGVGGNIEDAWSYILYEKILQKEPCSGFFNLSRSGWGWSKIITNSLIYFKKYGYPDTYFIMLPNNCRKFNYFENQQTWKYIQKYPKFYGIPKSKSNPLTGFELEAKEYLEDFVNFLIAWKMFNKICKDNNVRLIFSTWDSLDLENLERIKLFDNFIDTGLQKIELYAKDYYKIKPIKKDDYKKRDGHSGRLIHHYWADEFYNEYKRMTK